VEPVEVLIILGIELDTNKMELILPKDKLKFCLKCIIDIFGRSSALLHIIWVWTISCSPERPVLELFPIWNLGPLGLLRKNQRVHGIKIFAIVSRFMFVDISILAT
jgi:hypothetical protein